MSNMCRFFSLLVLLAVLFPVAQVNAEEHAITVQQGGQSDVIPGYFKESAGEDADIRKWGGLGLVLLGGAGAVLLGYRLFSRRRSPVSPAPSLKKTGSSATKSASRDVISSGYWTPLDQTSTVVEDLANVEEEAEVFLLLGRIDMAIGVLRHHIESSSDTPPHVWITLLDVLHGQGLRGEFEKLAVEMKARFNVALPSWESANERSNALSGLEHLPHLLDKIVAHWKQPDCLGYLHSLTQDNRKGERSGFHQEAFRELLLLINILEFRAKLAV